MTLQMVPDIYWKKRGCLQMIRIVMRNVGHAPTHMEPAACFRSQDLEEHNVMHGTD